MRSLFLFFFALLLYSSRLILDPLDISTNNNKVHGDGNEKEKGRSIKRERRAEGKFLYT
jgi:hypothetical protein